MSENNVGRFFDSITSDYTATIERCFPRYREMLWALLESMPNGDHIESVLELGCGTGNLSVLLADAFPHAKLHFVDTAGESLDVCRSRLGTDRRLTFDQRDVRELEFADGSFDLITSSIAIHHLVSSEKQTLFRRCQSWLSDGGFLVFSDQCAGATELIYERHIQNWKSLSMRAGSSPEEWEMWMKHQLEHDHHDSVTDHIDWIRSAGFPVIDCPWRYLLWTVVFARK